MKYAQWILFAGVAMFLFSCEKKSNDDDVVPASPDPTLNLSFRFQVDGLPLEFDTIRYENDAHNNYSVNTLVFYLTQLSLVKPDQSVIQIKDWLYIDARTSSTLEISIKDIPRGCYTGLRFNIGIDSTHNRRGGLPATADNLMMEWPDAMGGGYHFLKLEGYFTDSSGAPGYAMHLGTNICLTPVQLTDAQCFEDADVSKILTVNVNEWFRTPEIYDFNIDGNSIMGNVAAMTKIAANGTDVFTIQ